MGHTPTKCNGFDPEPLLQPLAINGSFFTELRTEILIITAKQSSQIKISSNATLERDQNKSLRVQWLVYHPWWTSFSIPETCAGTTRVKEILCSRQRVRSRWILAVGSRWLRATEQLCSKSFVTLPSVLASRVGRARRPFLFKDPLSLFSSERHSLVVLECLWSLPLNSRARSCCWARLCEKGRASPFPAVQGSPYVMVR